MHFFEMFNIEDCTVLQIFCPVLSDFDKKNSNLILETVQFPDAFLKKKAKANYEIPVQLYCVF